MSEKDRENKGRQTTQPSCVPGGSGIIIRRRRHGWRIRAAAICAIKRVGVRRGRISVYLRMRILATAADVRRAVGGIFLWQLKLSRCMHT